MLKASSIYPPIKSASKGCHNDSYLHDQLPLSLPTPPFRQYRAILKSFLSLFPAGLSNMTNNLFTQFSFSVVKDIMYCCYCITPENLELKWICQARTITWAGAATQEMPQLFCPTWSVIPILQMLLLSVMTEKLSRHTRLFLVEAVTSSAISSKALHTLIQ